MAASPRAVAEPASEDKAGATPGQAGQRTEHGGRPAEMIPADQGGVADLATRLAGGLFFDSQIPCRTKLQV